MHNSEIREKFTSGKPINSIDHRAMSEQLITVLKIYCTISMKRKASYSVIKSSFLYL